MRTKKMLVGVIAALALVGGAATPALATPAVVTVSGNVYGDIEWEQDGTGEMLFACASDPALPGFEASACSQGEASEYWYANSSSGGSFEITDFPAGKYLVAGDVNDPYGKYHPQALAASPITADASGLHVTLVSRPEVDTSDVTASLNPRQVVIGQAVRMNVTGVPEGASIQSYQWPGDTWTGTEGANAHSAEYTVPENDPEQTEPQDFMAIAFLVQPGHRTTPVAAASPYPAWDSAEQGGVIRGTITDSGKHIEAPWNIQLAICDRTGTDLGIASNEAYQVTRIDATHFAYEIIVPNGSYCLSATVYGADGQDQLLASTENPYWIPVVNDDFSSAQLFEVNGAVDAKKEVVVDLDYAPGNGPTGDPIELMTSPTFSSGKPTVGKSFAMTKQPKFAGAPVDSVTYTWTNGARTLGSGNRAYVPTASDAGKALFLVVDAERGDESYSHSFFVGTVAAAAMPTGSVTKMPKSVTGVKKGKIKAGATVKVTPPKVKLAGAKVSYQWTVNGKKIAKATKAKFSVAKKYKGKKIGVIITVSKPGYKSVTKTLKAGKVV